MSHRPRKRFGQNFLHDQHVLDRIVASADLQKDDRILEIGPGPGALTTRLLATGLPVLAVEIDRDLAAALQERNEPNLEVKVGDVLRFDWAELLQKPPYKLIANLPYNISSQILFKALDHRHSFSRLILMFQKEVGERMIAEVGSRNYGILSVLMQTWFHVEKVIKVPPGAFFPPPKVDSVVISLELLSTPRVNLMDETLYRKLVKSAFAQRRKTVRNSLLGTGWVPESIDKAFSETGYDPGRRGETFSIEEFGALANLLSTYVTGE